MAWLSSRVLPVWVTEGPGSAAACDQLRPTAFSDCRVEASHKPGDLGITNEEGIGMRIELFKGETKTEIDPTGAWLK
ncbi:hypothetical protein PV379_22175, partial [Streptomyces caniscabiei]|uniref:hypothetical protein n=1 Tax=Streptomyces caniscabiei TaxID=2746961 RepID=UPI0029A1CC36|nr:hypothetical protein [Streptomyces caniscabiei]